MKRPYTIKPLNTSTWDGFAAMVVAHGGVWGGCWCMSFHSEGIGKHATAELNRERKHRRVLNDTAHAALVFDGDDCVGWCQFGEPDEIPKIKNRSTYERHLKSLPDWRIGCLFVARSHRRKGISGVALGGAVEMIALLGGGIVEGYPEDGSAAASFLTNGSLDIYKDLGFTQQRQVGKRRWVVQRTVNGWRASDKKTDKSTIDDNRST